MRFLIRTLITILVANMFFMLGCAYMGVKVTSGKSFLMGDNKNYYCNVKL